MDEASLRPPPGERLVLLGTGDGLFRYWAAGTLRTRHLQGLAIHALLGTRRQQAALLSLGLAVLLRCALLLPLPLLLLATSTRSRPTRRA
jgi:hypothetical protein